jgi:hypothetical protein
MKVSFIGLICSQFVRAAILNTTYKQQVTLNLYEENSKVDSLLDVILRG